MARVLALLACAAVCSAFRAVEEHRHTLTADAKTPAPILSALRAVQGIVDKHVQALQKATELAEEKKQAKTLQIEEKERIVKDVHAKTAAIALKAKASRELLLKVDKATTAHAEKGKEHAEAVEKFGTISDDLEDLAKNITYKEQMLQQIVEKLKRQIAALRARMDVRLNDKELAEAEMNQLKDEAMSAGKFKTGAEQEQAQAEEAMQTAQKELRGMQTKLDTAIAAATVAETEESKATNLLEEAANRESEAKKTRMLLQKLRKAVKDYFTSLEEVEISMEGKAPEDLQSLPETKAAFESWNLMVSSFRELHAFDKEIYVKVKPAVTTIQADSKEAIKLACDQGRKMSDDELEELCITGVWAHLEMKEITFPTD